MPRFVLHLEAKALNETSPMLRRPLEDLIGPSRHR